MKKKLLTLMILILAPLLLLSGQDFENDEFAARRAAFILGPSHQPGTVIFSRPTIFIISPGLRSPMPFLLSTVYTRKASSFSRSVKMERVVKAFLWNW